MTKQIQEKIQVRKPVQKRSIEKKNKIVTAGFLLISKKGYHNVTTPDIAKAAGVSTGIIYNYFNDKHDILIEGMKTYMNDLFFPMINIDVNAKIKKSELSKLIKNMLDSLIERHKKSKISHEKIMEIVTSDEEVSKYYEEMELKMSDQLTTLLINNGFNKTNLKEKVHIIMGLSENLCHEIVYHNHKELNYTKMYNIVYKTILNILDL